MCFSTKVQADVVVYPDSKKFAAAATDDPDAWAKGNFWIREIRSLDDGKLQYFDGEDVG